jgi:hypothetical protein
MRMYYRSPDVIVTGDHFVILRPQRVQYRIDFLEDVYIVQHARTGRLRSGSALEIRARYGVRDVRLFHTTNSTTFGQVRRALIRAIERRDQARRFAVRL